MSGFVKLYGTILDSSVWGEPAPTVKVWITLLAMADQFGVVRASLPGLARRAVVSREECEAAVQTFLSPDPDSQDKKRSPESDGRRIEEVPEGWRVLNHSYYRDLRTDKQVADAERQKRHREGSPKPDERDMSQVSQRVATEAEADSEAVKSSSSQVEEKVDTGKGVPPEYLSDLSSLLRKVRNPEAWGAEFRALRQGMRGKIVSSEHLGRAIRDYMAFAPAEYSLSHFRAFVNRAVKEDQPTGRNNLKADATVRAMEIVNIIRTKRKPGYFDQFSDAEKRAIELVTLERIMTADTKEIGFIQNNLAKALAA